MEADEYQSMKDDTIEQIKEFTDTLSRLNKGDVTLTSKISQMRKVCHISQDISSNLIINFRKKIHFPYFIQTIRKAIASSFNTVEIVRMFGDHSVTELVTQLISLEESQQLKKIPIDEYESKKHDILLRLYKGGHSLSMADKMFLERKTDLDILKDMRRVEDDI